MSVSRGLGDKKCGISTQWIITQLLRQIDTTGVTSKWTELEIIIILSRGTQTQKDKSHMFSLIPGC